MHRLVLPFRDTTCCGALLCEWPGTPRVKTIIGVARSGHADLARGQAVGSSQPVPHPADLLVPGPRRGSGERTLLQALRLTSSTRRSSSTWARSSTEPAGYNTAWRSCAEPRGQRLDVGCDDRDSGGEVLAHLEGE